MPTPFYIALHQGGLPHVCIATNEGGLLPRRFTLTPLCERGGMLSVALSVERGLLLPA